MKKTNVNKLVSVIMPTYNAEKYLEEAIESIIKQTHLCWELLIIDDGSTDNTQKIVQSYQERDARIKLITGPMEGIAAALNLGIEKSRGKYVARMDADDISLPERLEKQVDYMERNGDVDVCATLYKRFSGENREGAVILTPCCDNEIKAKMIFENVIAHPTIMFRKSTLMQGWRYDTRVVAEDYDLWTRMIPDLKFSCLQEILLFYRVLDESASHARQDDVRLSAQNSSRNCIERVFKISLDEYSNEYFGQVSNWGKIKESYFTFLKRELCMLYKIDFQNQILNVMDGKALREALQLRWKAMTDFLRPVLENAGGRKKTNNDFDLQCLFDKKVLLEKYYVKLESIERAYYQWMKKRKTFAIYGMGKRGKELLQQYFILKSNNQLAWNLTLLVDKNAVSINIEGKGLMVARPEHLKDHNVDIILVSSYIHYEEIRKELIDIGVEQEKIISGNIISTWS